MDQRRPTRYASWVLGGIWIVPRDCWYCPYRVPIYWLISFYSFMSCLLCTLYTLYLSVLFLRSSQSRHLIHKWYEFIICCQPHCVCLSVCVGFTIHDDNTKATVTANKPPAPTFEYLLAQRGHSG